MKDWSIAKRLKFGMGGMGAIVLLLALGALGSTLLLKDEFSTYRTSSTLAEISTDVAEDLFEAQAAATNYGFNADSSAREEYQSNIDEVLDARQAFLVEARDKPDLIAQIEALYIELGTYVEQFEIVSAQQAERGRLYAALDAQGLEVRDTVSALMDASNRMGDAGQTFSAARVQQAMLVGQIYFEQFFLSGNLATLALAQEQLAQAAQQLSWSATMMSDAQRRDLVTGAREQIAAYIETTEGIAAATATQKVAEGEMALAEGEMLKLTDVLVDALSTERKTMSGLIDKTFLATLIGLVLATTAAVAAAMGLTRATIPQVTKEFDTTLDTVAQLADGNLDVEITGTERDTELGRIAQALEVFRTRGKEANELARQNAAARAEREAEEQRRVEERAVAERERKAAEDAAAEARKQEIFDALRRAVSGVVSAAAAGNFSQRVETDALDPELARLAEEINRLMANVEGGLGEIAKVSERLADGDLREGMIGRFEGTFAALQGNIEQMIASLGGIVSEISAEADNVRAQASDMTRGAEDLSRRAESQAASLEQTSAAMTQIASAAESNASAAAQTDSAAREMSNEAGQARDVLDSTIKAMADIQEGSKEIEAIVDVIEDIAFQTNLLSLNASVEAARAGEAGKGFAVVANEVRALAQRSAEASSKVQQIITQSTGAISRGSGAVGETGEALSRIVERIETVSSNLREIKSASEEQATAVKDVSNAFAQLDKITQRNAAVAEETRGSAALLSSQSERMQASVGRVKVRSGEKARGPEIGTATDERAA